MYPPPCLSFPFGKCCCLRGDVAEEVSLVEGEGSGEQCPARGLAVRGLRDGGTQNRLIWGSGDASPSSDSPP